MSALELGAVAGRALQGGAEQPEEAWGIVVALVERDPGDGSIADLVLRELAVLPHP